MVYFIEITAEDILSEYEALLRELKLFDSSLLDKPRMIVLTKTDLIPENKKPEIPSSLNDQICMPISAVTGDGIDHLLKNIIGKLAELKHEA